jgi:ferrous iron transport protein A
MRFFSYFPLTNSKYFSIFKIMSQSQSLSSLKPGDKARIAGYRENCEKSCKMKLLSLGLTKETEILAVKTAPFGDPIEIELRGYRLSLRKHEAEAILCIQ